MFLDVGNQQRFDNPTPEQVCHALRNLPMDAPFLILDADDEQFVQAAPEGGGWRIEWRQEGEQRFMIASLQRVEEVFAAFLRWDEPALTLLPWKRLTLWNDPCRRPLFFAVGLLVIALAALWSALR